MISPAVDVAVHQDDAAVLVVHVLVGVNFFFLRAVGPIRAKLEQVAAGPVTRRGIDVVVVKNRRGDDCRPIRWLQKMPQQAPIVGRNPRQAFHRLLDVLANPANFRNDDRGVTHRIGQVFGLPDLFACLLVKCRDRAFPAPWRTRHFVTVNER